ncbi:MAG: hypothetical protein COW24_01110 [Candidatus Kerfeldbacteria bacterium CG15_BIG_FIL_POST_REV_8_21_14_020_45_12]|uniref:Cobalamin biosynthesis protein CbiM n=1 Tax=Candidatus Kerfeldbacteria bacterium CG15_BIG_FIL_POST_REV_8_21_14_020_45_12 TaxID=2014247 RepID=A0A2M7H4Y7_9BACT|nr:MAG: hypothetical protein COW24_01110 [Candidatus Kerfeldbacteria bacterium CG15_BIG_FIL_POST_REV_8_21_14_020_45_12]PJA93679.1 MAG: hypothetical protein CO132_01950 [Candidatus Kerfeldbacteria bacterium CG_4_9_14_3_um_filter_45_8]
MKKIIGLSLWLAPVASLAHGGHGETDSSTILHWFAEPVHAVPLATIIGVSIFAILHRYYRSIKNND